VTQGPDRLALRWTQLAQSSYAWEQEGLSHIRSLMPDAPPYRAVALFSFTALSGRINECDLFIATPGGLYLVELKGHPGRVTNRGADWTFRFTGSDGRGHTLHLPNPLHTTDLKCKELRDRLKRAAKALRLNIQIPWIEPAIFLSAPDLESHLDEGERIKVYGRDDRSTGLPKIWTDLLGRAPQSGRSRISASFTDELPKLLDQIGVAAARAHLKFGDDWLLEPKPLDQGPTWEDRLARRTGLADEQGRVRIYLAEEDASEQTRTAIVRAAEREYNVLQGLRHRGIAEAWYWSTHKAGPAILFRHSAEDLRLDRYLTIFAEQLDFETRLGLVRQLAEALRYAHRRSLYHRTLAARSIYVSAGREGAHPVLRVIDWQTAARDFSSTAMSRIKSLGRDAVTGRHLAEGAGMFLAPEFAAEYPDPAALDVYGLGAVGYLILTGQPPARSEGELLARLEQEQGLHPAALVDGLGQDADQLIYDSTRFSADDRLESVDEFLDRLSEIERGAGEEAVAAQAPVHYVDPLEARPGDWLDEALLVKQELGTGGTGKVLLVEQLSEDDEGEVQVSTHVLKVALNQTDATDRLRAEADALRKVGGGQIVRLVKGPFELQERRTVLLMQYAGDRTLGRELRENGRLPYVRLQNFADNLFHALGVLERDEVVHRDIKPDNLGVFKIPRNDERELLLFDFSLSNRPATDLTSGTTGYLDPFLNQRSGRTRFDAHAERYAAAVTLHQMASGERPIWGNGAVNPKSLPDEYPTISSEQFLEPLRDGLTDFFRRALHRDADQRFDSCGEMYRAWRRVFTEAERTTPQVASGQERPSGSAQEVAAQRDAAAAVADLDTALDVAGLSPAALDVAQSLGASTVGGLLGVPQHLINTGRGAGTLAKRELNKRYREWASRLRGAVPARTEVPDTQSPETDDTGVPSGTATERKPVDVMARDLIDALGGSRHTPVMRAFLGLPDPGTEPGATALLARWPTNREAARAAGQADETAVNAALPHAVRKWRALPWMDLVRGDIHDLLLRAGRVMTAAELTAELRAQAGAGTSDRELALCYASAVVRAGLWVENDREDSRFGETRRDEMVYVAIEASTGSSTPQPVMADLVGYAHELGRCADQAVGNEPLPSVAAVRTLLRAVSVAEYLAPLSEGRLVALAAAASRYAHASPRGDLYPRQLPLARALRLSQAAVGVGHAPGVTVNDLLARIRVRFPELDFGDVTYTQLELALKDAGYPLHYDVPARVFRGPQRSALAATATPGRTSTNLTGTPATARHAALQRLAESLEFGGFRALTVHAGQMPGIAAGVAARHPVRPIDVNASFLATFRALAEEKGQDWAKVLRVDGRLRVSSDALARAQAPSAYSGYVAEVFSRLRADWRDEAGDPAAQTTLFLHNAGLLARYWDLGGRDILTEFQQAARRAGTSPHGLWLLCAAENAARTPQLDGRTVETIIPDGEWIVLGRAAAEVLRGVGGPQAGDNEGPSTSGADE